MPRPWTLPVSFPLQTPGQLQCEIAANGMFVIYLANRNGSTTTIGGGQVDLIAQRYATRWRDSTVDAYEAQILARINGDLGDQ